MTARGNCTTCGTEPENYISHSEILRMDASLNRHIARQPVCSSTQAPWADDADVASERACGAVLGGGTSHVTVRWRIGASSIPPRTIRRPSESTVAELLDALVASDASRLQRRGELVVADCSSLAPFDSSDRLGDLAVGPSLSVALVPCLELGAKRAQRPAGRPVPTQQPPSSGTGRVRRPESDASSVSGLSSRSRIFGDGGVDVHSGKPAAPDRPADAGRRRHLSTILYRMGRSSGRAPRALLAGPHATVQDVLEEIAEREPRLARALAGHTPRAGHIPLAAAAGHHHAGVGGGGGGGGGAPRLTTESGAILPPGASIGELQLSGSTVTVFVDV
jgi:hypothetical protein